MLHYVQVKNFRSFRDARIDFSSPFTAIIGANNTGKSSVIHLLNYLKMMTSTPLGTIFSGVNAFQFIHTQGAEGPLEISLLIDSVQNIGVKFEYRFAFALTGPGGWLRVNEESLV